MNVELGDHQLKAIKELENGKILAGGVGSGKSRTSIAYFFTKVCGGQLRVNGIGDSIVPTRPRDLYIITTAKKRDDLDWDGEFAPFGLAKDRSKSLGSIQVTVDSWNNITKYADVKNAFFILDEQRLLGSGAWVKSFLKIAKANQWILLSATPGDVWMDFCPVFVANGFYRNKTDFQTQHVVWSRYAKFPKIERYTDTGILLRYRRQLLVQMPVERHTRRNLKIVKCDYDQSRYLKLTKERWHIYEERPVRDVSELFAAMRKLVNSDPSRLDKVRELAKEFPRLIIFYNFNYELEALRSLADEMSDTRFAEWNGHKHERVPSTERWIYLVQYTAGAEGWNCVTTNVTIFYSLNYSYKVWEQAQGRIDRLNTKYTDLYYYVLKSDASIDGAIMKSLKSKKNFNEKDYVSK